MKICHVTSVHPVYDVRIFHKECCSLAKKYNVWLIAPNVADHEKDGVHIAGVNIPGQRIKRMLSQRSVYKRALNIDADIYHLHDPELIPVGIKLHKKGKKVIFDSHEDVPQQILAKEWLPRWIAKLVSSLYASYEKRSLRKYDALVTVTPTITERLLSINPQTYQITNFPINKEVPDQRKWNDSVCFTGGIESQWMHENVIKAVENTGVRYLLAGSFYPNSYMTKLRSLSGWKNIDYKGRIPHSECISLIQSSTAGIAVLDYMPNVGYKKGSIGNSKLFEYMQAGIPVIATDFELWRDIIDTYDCGICVNPHDCDAITNAISYLISNKDEAKRKGDNGKEAVKKYYNWSSQEKILFSLYENLTQ